MSSSTDYGRLDRALHRVAFATLRAQLGIADIEERVFRRELEATEVGAPVLVTALPRAGTTILLELLAGCPEFAAHTYRDMPFVLCPMLWRRLSRRFRRRDTPHERAHGDGIEISLDSPEAFEEMIWSLFWPEHHGARTIAPWTTCRNDEFVEFWAAHRRKIVALRRRDEPRARRYVSKNNLNIARIPALWDVVPDAQVVVPFRDPVQHAASLLLQHLRFTALHRADGFGRRYMAAIGHYDFGANLRPVDFDGWFGSRELSASEHLEFWLDYWLASYRHLLRHTDDERLVLVSFERLGATGDVTTLARRLGVADVAELQQRAATLRPARHHDIDLSGVSPQMRDALAATFAELERRAVG